MERTLNPEERIRRAEEIYYKRKMQNSSCKSARVNVSNKKDFKLLRKMILQIAICILIYSIYYIIQNTNYIFSEDIITRTKEILSYDVNLENLYNQTIQYLNQFKDNQNDKLENNVAVSENENTTNKSIEEENVGGENIIVEDSNEDQNLSQMEKDAKDILENKSIILPLKGTITSRFGPRNPETPTVSKNHTGIDIAVNEGTVFNSAMSGIVEEVSSERRFRKSYKNCK